MSENAIYCWNFVLNQNLRGPMPDNVEHVNRAIEPFEVEAWLEKRAKKWAFQLEQGEKNGYIHYQGKCSLIKKKRYGELWNMIKTTREDDPTELDTFFWAQWQPSVTGNTSNFSYEMKIDSRIEGPWTDKIRVKHEEPVFIPRQLRHITTLYPWQQTIVDSRDIFDERGVDCVIDRKGREGKSTVINYCRAYKKACCPPQLMMRKT